MPANTDKGQSYLNASPYGSSLPIDCLDWISSRFADVQNWCLQLSLHVARLTLLDGLIFPLRQNKKYLYS